MALSLFGNDITTWFGPKAAERRAERRGDRRDDRLDRQGQRQTSRGERVGSRQDARVKVGGNVLDKAGDAIGKIGKGKKDKEAPPAEMDPMILILGALGLGGVLFVVSNKKKK